LALLRLFPKIPVDARRFLRRPLARWHVAATKFLQSPRQRVDDLRFTATLFSIMASGSHHQSWIAAMFCGLYRKADEALAQNPVDCPHRYSCALLSVVEYLFDDAGRSQ
jgi:hypothetical protein